MSVYRLYGYHVAGPEELFEGFPTANATKNCDLTVDFTSNLDFQNDTPLILTSRRSMNGTPRFSIYRKDRVLFFVLANTAIFSITSDQILIEALRHTKESGRIIRSTFFSYIVTFWLELRGNPCLHGAAVGFRQGAIICLAHKGVGKSTLTVELLKAGGKLMSDDISSLDLTTDEGYVLPGPPFIRLWPDQIAALGLDVHGQVQSFSDSSKVILNINEQKPESYSSEPQKLFHIFILNRRTESNTENIELSQLPRAAALYQILNYSFAPKAVQAFGIEKERIQTLSRIATNVPVTLIQYPTGIHQISRIVAMIFEMIE